jgi:DNA helicase HerA-like ATPase
LVQNVLQEALGTDPLARLADPSAFIGWVYGIDYESALVLTNDLWKDDARGVPQNAFLTAAPFYRETYSRAQDADRAVLLLRVVGTARMPSADDLVATRIDYLQRQPGRELQQLDALTQNQLQHHALECHILGTFYIDRELELRLGSDIETFSASGNLNVFRPAGDALELIVNYLDPDVRRRAAADIALLAVGAGQQVTATEPLRFRLGTVRYTSTDRIHRAALAELVPVYLPAADFLARRTAVFGMTRSGKSNTIKHLVSAVKRVADETHVPIGQLLFDLRGEYASANVQDRDDADAAASLATAFAEEVVRYRTRPTPGFEVILNNFFEQIPEGLAIIREVVREEANASAIDVQTFLQMSLEEPDASDVGLHRRWEVKKALYASLLARAGFGALPGYRVRFQANASIRGAVDPLYTAATGQGTCPDPAAGLTLQQAQDWFLAARDANRNGQLMSSSGTPWFDAEGLAMLNMLAQRNDNNTFIRGVMVLNSVREYHSPSRTRPVEPEIYDHLVAGKIVIVDLSIGPTLIRDRVTDRIARHIFNRSQEAFLRGEVPPSIAIYIEEAHNLISRSAELTDTWPTMAKEGAKFRISLVYATQEPTSIHPNILANTENWIVTHLNNDDELRTLGKYYDFGDFSKSLKRATDVGFARIRTLSGKFVIPVQVDRFTPGTAAAELIDNEGATG